MSKENKNTWFYFITLFTYVEFITMTYNDIYSLGK